MVAALCLFHLKTPASSEVEHSVPFVASRGNKSEAGESPDVKNVILRNQDFHQ